MSTTKTKSRLKVSSPAPAAHHPRIKEMAPFELTLGSDPEIMLVDTQDGNAIISAHRVLGRDKHDPILLGKQGEIKTYFDNALMEVSFPPVTQASGRIVEHMREVFSEMQKHLGARYQLLPQAAHYYHPKELDDERLWQVGCNPSFCAYTGAESLPGHFTDTLRSGSAHIHLGRSDFRDPSDDRLMTKESKIETIKMMDTFVGVGGVMITRDPTALARRRLYGLAGQWRPTVYGAEYRCLESYALNTPELTQLIWDLTAHAMSHIQNGTAGVVIQSCEAGEVQAAINHCDKALSLKILKQAQLPAPLLARVQKHYETPGMAKAWGLAAA